MHLLPFDFLQIVEIFFTEKPRALYISNAKFLGVCGRLLPRPLSARCEVI